MTIGSGGRMADRGDAADGEAGGLADEVGIGPLGLAA